MEVEHVDYQRLSWLWRRERVAVAGWSRSPGGKWKTVEDELMAIYKPCISR